MNKKSFTPKENTRLKKELPACSGLVDHLDGFGLAGRSFLLEEKNDLSGLGASLQFLSAEDILFEALEAYPGIPAVKEGYLPTALCLRGSGDSYYLAPDQSLVRIPHTAVGDQDELLLEEVENVAPGLVEFLASAVEEL